MKINENNLGYLKVYKVKIPGEISNIESQYACSWFHPSLWPLRLLDVSVFYLSVKADSDFKVVVDALHSVLRPDATPKKSMATYVDASHCYFIRLNLKRKGPL